MARRGRRWYVLLEETDFDTYSVSGPFVLTDALGLTRELNRSHPATAHVVNGDSGYRVPGDYVVLE